MSDPFEWIKEELSLIHDKKLFRLLTELETGQSPEVTIEGKNYILLGSNSYLGLSVDPKVVESAKLALEKYGTGSGGSRLVSGSSDLHRMLEEKIAEFKNTQAAILFSSGYLANIGTISALVGDGDIIYSDELNHASIIDGARLSRSTVRIYKHLDLNNLNELLEKDKNKNCKKLIITDSVFSMDGTWFLCQGSLSLHSATGVC
jgi:7-keto-8-aminopelargonate synthetase-like enzyme